MADKVATKEIQEAPKAAPAVTIIPGEEPSVVIPAKALTYEEADAKIREGADSFLFSTANGGLGRVDVVSLGTKLPLEDHWDVGVVKGAEGQGDTLYAGIFDGHNGAATAEVLKKNLIPYVAKTLENSPKDRHLGDALCKAFVTLDNCIMGIAEATLAAGHPAGAAEMRVATAPAFAGSCALLLMYEPQPSPTLWVALTGDSRAVRACRSSATDSTPDVSAMTVDQNVFNKDEVGRVKAEHPGEEADLIEEAWGSYMGMGVTRAFGNHRWKWPAELVARARGSCHSPRPLAKAKTPPYLTAAPVVTASVIGPDDFVILGSDGLWEAISHEDAVECVRRWLAARRSSGTQHEPAAESRESKYDVNEDGSLSRTARPEDFSIDDLDNAAVCLLKNVLGGRHRYMVPGALTATAPISRYVRDDITVQVIFLKAP